MKNLILRSVSGIILVAVLIFSIFYSEGSKAAILMVIGLFTLKEILTLSSVEKRFNLKHLVTVVCVAILLLSYVNCVRYILPLVVLMLFVRFAFEIYNKDMSNVARSLSCEVLGSIYVALPVMILLDLEAEVILYIFVMVWTNDVGAYLVGSMIGKNRLFERVSPKKSWEGFWGGFIFTLLVSYFYGSSVLGLDTLHVLTIGAVVSVAAVYGDLFESLFKRSFGVKDSGNIIPGHGGFWDRFDALFFAAPAYYLVCELFKLI